MSKILVGLSGGVESTYGAYRLLTETNHDITLFHLYFRNHPRYEGETEACEHITNWLEKNTRDFSWKSANICIDEKDYDEARFFMNDDEYNKVTFDFPFAINLFNLILGRFPKINTKLIIDSVVGNLDKKEIYKRIPKELRQHIYSNDKEYNK